MLIRRPSGFATLSAAHLYPNEDRSGGYETVTLVASGDDLYTGDVEGLDDGRYFITVIGTLSAGGPGSRSQGLIDLPERDDLLFSAETVAEEAGMTLPLSGTQRRRIWSAIENAQADVQAYLNRDSLTPIMYIDTGRWPLGDEWNLTADDVVAVLSVDPETIEGQPTGAFTVTYLAGLDARTSIETKPIRRYVLAHVLNSDEFLRMWRIATGDEGEITSVNVEGQGVSYKPRTFGASGGKPGDGAPGSLPTLASLDRFKRYSVHQGPTHASDWPYTGQAW